MNGTVNYIYLTTAILVSVGIILGAVRKWLKQYVQQIAEASIRDNENVKLVAKLRTEIEVLKSQIRRQR